MTVPHVLMCPPKYYGVHYEINPWMNRRRPVDRDLAQHQWDDLRQLIGSLGASISLVDPVAGLPDMVFTANAGLIYRQQAVVSNFRFPQRRPERALYARWFASHGFQVRHLPDTLCFEGAGDALFCGETLFGGYRFRSHARAHQLAAEMIGCRVIPMALTNSYFYHLDTCFCPLDLQTTAYYPGAFDMYGITAIEEHIPRRIVVCEQEARHFACNAVVIGKQVITNTGCPELHSRLRDLGFTPHETPLGEFVKAGGSAKCLTLRLDGEEGAAWKYRREGTSGD